MIHVTGTLGGRSWGCGKRRSRPHGLRSSDTALSSCSGQKGFHTTRIQDIADRLRISEATFFNYFPTKESVLEAVADGVIDGSIAILEREASDRARPVAERLADLATEFADQLDGDPDFVVLLAGNTRYFLGIRTARFERALALLAQLFVEGQSRGEVRDDIAATRSPTVPLSDVRGDPELGAGRWAGPTAA